MLRAFFRTEAGSTSVLLGATLVALLGPTPRGATPTRRSGTQAGSSFGDAVFSLDLRHWVNDGLMTVFFFLIGLEISYEVRLGQLTDRRLMAVPAVAAFGGCRAGGGLPRAERGRAGAGGWGCRSPPTPRSCWGVLAIVGALSGAVAGVPADARDRGRRAGHHHHRASSTTGLFDPVAVGGGGAAGRDRVAAPAEDLAGAGGTSCWGSRCGWPRWRAGASDADRHRAGLSGGSCTRPPTTSRCGRVRPSRAVHQPSPGAGRRGRRWMVQRGGRR